MLNNIESKPFWPGLFYAFYCIIFITLGMCFRKPNQTKMQRETTMTTDPTCIWHIIPHDRAEYHEYKAKVKPHNHVICMNQTKAVTLSFRVSITQYPIFLHLQWHNHDNTIFLSSVWMEPEWCLKGIELSRKETTGLLGLRRGNLTGNTIITRKSQPADIIICILLIRAIAPTIKPHKNPAELYYEALCAILFFLEVAIHCLLPRYGRQPQDRRLKVWMPYVPRTNCFLIM